MKSPWARVAGQSFEGKEERQRENETLRSGEAQFLIFQQYQEKWAFQIRERNDGGKDTRCASNEQKNYMPTQQKNIWV